MKSKYLVIGTILLFVANSMNPFTGQKIEKTSQPTLLGNWLYVGGNGPNNYTKIQDAIDNASDDDTIFVYNDSSPYYENLIINKSIQLCGNNRENTIINGESNQDVVVIVHDNITITNFTITCSGEFNDFIQIIRVQNCNNISITHNFLASPYYMLNGITLFIYGISPLKTGILIQDNIINNTLNGIQLGHCSCRIEYNLIENTGYGIFIYPDDESHNFISNNTFHNCVNGIYLMSDENIIFYNTFNNCSIGIPLEGNRNIIQWNEFTSCRYYGISEYYGRQNEIHFNNFIHNNISAYFHWVFPTICINHWNENYWDDHHTVFPKSIPGIIQYRDDDFSNWYIPWVNFDWHPAQVPYDTPSMK